MGYGYGKYYGKKKKQAGKYIHCCLYKNCPLNLKQQVYRKQDMALKIIYAK
jgi:hypothetical protein